MANIKEKVIRSKKGVRGLFEIYCRYHLGTLGKLDSSFHTTVDQKTLKVESTEKSKQRQDKCLVNTNTKNLCIQLSLSTFLVICNGQQE